MECFEKNSEPFCTRVSEPFYTSESGSVQAFYGISEVRDNLPILITSYDLTGTDLAEKVDEVLDFGLEQARDEGKRLWKILEMHVGVEKAPQRYCVVHLLQASTTDSAEQSLVQELVERETLWRARSQATSARQGLISEHYYLHSWPFYESNDLSVKLFQGACHIPIVAKRHEFAKSQGELQTRLASAINAGLAQARAQHPNTCDILAVHFDTSAAPSRYYVYHILEALDKDVEKEILQRKEESRPLSEPELWDFLEQMVSALVQAHAKVRAR